MLCNAVYIVKQFITSKPTLLDGNRRQYRNSMLDIDQGYAFRVTAASSLSSNMVYRLSGSISYPKCMEQTVSQFNFTIFIFLKSSIFFSAFSTVTHNWPRWFFHWSEPDYNWPVISRTILSTSNMFHLHLLVSKLLTFSFKFNLQALTSTILAGSSSSRWIYSLPLVRRSFQLWVLWSSYLTPTHCDRPGTMNDAKKR